VSVSTTPSTVKITGTKTASSGTFQIVIDYVPGAGIKETMRAYNNNPAWNNHNIGFTETFEVPRILKFGNQEYDLSNYNGTTLNRAWIEANNAKITKLTDSLFYDFGIGYDNLESIKITWTGTVAKLSMNYLFVDDIVPYQEWFEVDPTFGYSTGNFYRAATTSSANTNCNSGTSTDTTATNVMDPSTGAGNCLFVAVEWDISSLPTTIVVTNTNFRIDTGSLLGVARNCDVKAMANRPSTASAATLWTDINDGTAYISNNAFCASAASDWVLDLGTSADTDIKNARAASQAWWGVGIPYNPNTRNADAHRVSFAQPELQITYVSSPPNNPTGLTATSNARQVQFSWTQSDGSGITDNLLGRSLDNSTYPVANKTSIGNVTSYTSTAYWRPGLLYYVNVTATNGGFNSTATYTSFTMDDYPDPPSIVLAPISGTAVNATRTAGASDGGDVVDDFGLRCEINNTGGWQTVVSNSTLPSNNKYTISSLWSTGDVIICQWRDGNDVGWSAWSANATYPAPPDAVDDLSVVSVFQTTAQISWTAPGLHGLPLWGYQVNFTTPWGSPLTEITVTNSSDTEYEIAGLTPNTQYSFRVSAVTGAGNNASGNIVNIATPSDFTPGDIDLDTENPLRFPIRFEATELNSTTTQLDVIYDNEFEMDCDMYFEFAQDTQSFDNLNGTAYSDNEDVSTFYFNNPENEVITIDCTDSITNATGTYQMIQSAFPLIELITNFRTGEYGTQGQFGALDLITIIVVIIAMIGFNRVNPAVGAIFMFIIVGSLAYFGIIQWYSAITGFIALILMLAIASTRKDD
jgi:hypothetical protein